jgi:hypothetical protein
MDDKELQNIVNKRKFFLSLSAISGQHLAHDAGFAVPSEDVQRHEVIDTVSSWMVLAGVGITSEMLKCIDWLLASIKKHESMTPEEELNSRAVISSFSGAFLIHLLENGYIELNPDLAMVEEHLAKLKEAFGDFDV